MDSRTTRDRLLDNVAQVRANIERACRLADRSPDSVRLVVVTKYVDVALVGVLLEAGLGDIGESRVQQLVQRAEALGSSKCDLFDAPDSPTAPRWHMIGHLQRNKVKTLLRHTRIIHSLDTPRLAEEISNRIEHDEHDRRPADVFLEVNIAGELAKSGASPADALQLAEAIQTLPHLRLRGLMTMAPLVADPEQVRPHFARLRTMLEQMQSQGIVPETCKHLSMGMSNDYAVAIEEGATLVRIGSALFAGL